MSRWTEDERRVLRENAGKLSGREIAALVGRPRMATLKKMSDMGLVGMPAGRSPQITQAQLDAIRAVRPGVSLRKLAKQIGLGSHCVRHWARKLGIRVQGCARFTPAECDALRAMDGKATLAVAAAELGRPRDTVSRKAHLMQVCLLPSKRLGRARASKPAARRGSEPAKVRLRKPPALKPEKKKPAIALAPARKQPEVSCLENCPQCRAPVSNWAQHYERMGHRRPA